MDKEKIIQAVSGFVEEELESSPGYFLVAVKVTPANQVSVFIDADQNASIDRLALINRALYKKMEAGSLFGAGGNFSLEVSSPGLDEPLKLHRQYRKNAGRRIEVLLNNGIRKEGILREVRGDGILLEQIAGSKKDKRKEQVEISFDQIKFTKICVVF